MITTTELNMLLDTNKSYGKIHRNSADFKDVIVAISQ